MPPTHLKAQVESFLLIHSHRLHFLASLERSLTACQWAFPGTSISWNSLDVKVATNFMQPTSTVQIITFQPHCSASVANSMYLSSPFSSPSQLLPLSRFLHHNPVSLVQSGLVPGWCPGPKNHLSDHGLHLTTFARDGQIYVSFAVDPSTAEATGKAKPPPCIGANQSLQHFHLRDWNACIRALACQEIWFCQCSLGCWLYLS